MIDDIGALSFRDLDALAQLITSTVAAGGVTSGEAVQVLGRDGRGVVVAMVAGAALGVRIVLLNTAFAGPQLTDVLAREDCRGRAARDSEFATALAGTPVRAIGLDEVLAFAASQRTGRSRLPVPDRPGGIVLLSSGTTGAPIGAPRERVSIFQSAAFLDRVPLPAGRQMVVAAPLVHGTGLSQFVLELALRCPVVLHRRFDAETTLASIAVHRAGAVVLVPTMLQRIVALAPHVLQRYDTSSLEVVLSAGSSLAPDLARRTMLMLGPVLHNLYGSTEVAVALVATPTDLARAPGTVGRRPSAAGWRFTTTRAGPSRVPTRSAGSPPAAH